MIGEVRCCFHHAPRVARGVYVTAFAEIGHEVVVAAFITPSPGKVMREDAVFEVFAESLTNIGLGGVVVTLAIELAGAGETWWFNVAQNNASFMPVIDSNHIY